MGCQPATALVFDVRLAVCRVASNSPHMPACLHARTGTPFFTTPYIRLYDVHKAPLTTYYPIRVCTGTTLLTYLPACL